MSIREQTIIKQNKIMAYAGVKLQLSVIRVCQIFCRQTKK